MYYLLDHENPNAARRSNGKRGHYYPTRRRRLVVIVVHCTAGLEDLDLRGDDDSAEATARYAATTERVVSWHSGSDTDSVVELLPPSATAFHVRGMNSGTYGHEISKSDMTWADEPADWVAATLAQAASHLAGIARAAGIPLRRIGAAQARRAYASERPELGGFIGHAPLDPARRRDPGDDFPWGRFFDLMVPRPRSTEEDDEMLFISHPETKTVWVVIGDRRIPLRNPRDAAELDPQWRDKVKQLSPDHPLLKLPVKT